LLPVLVALGLTVSKSAWAGDEPPIAREAPAKPVVDLYGDPLPLGALVRMGTIRYAQGDSSHRYPVLAPDHKTGSSRLRVGKFLCGSL
jgi:hypothetical protein